MVNKTIKHDELVFVFGSNLAGKHGKGAAQIGKRFFGAKEGFEEGIQGMSYAIPTKDSQIRTLPLSSIQDAVNRFLDHARKTPDRQYMVTRIGCGLAGYQDAEIAPMFQHNRPDNVLVPGVWHGLLGLPIKTRVIIAGGREFNDYELLKRKCLHLLSQQKQVEIVSGAARGADTMGEKLQEEMGFDLAKFPAAWDRFGKPSGMLRNSAMAWYATHLIAFWDGNSRGTQNMIELAKSEKLVHRVVITAYQKTPTSGPAMSR